jgi:hypothetical protein
VAYYYLASPYSRHLAGRAMAHMEVCQAAALLIRAGVPVFSPIAHSHFIAEYGGIDPNDHDIWLPADQPMMDAAGGLIVLMLDGWFRSKGMAYEMDHFRRLGRPVVYMTPGRVPEVLKQEGR